MKFVLYAILFSVIVCGGYVVVRYKQKRVEDDNNNWYKILICASLAVFLFLLYTWLSKIEMGFFPYAMSNLLRRPYLLWSAPTKGPHGRTFNRENLYDLYLKDKGTPTWAVPYSQQTFKQRLPLHEQRWIEQGY